MEPKKNPKHKIERYRTILFVVGLCVAGALSAAAIEFISVKTSPVKDDGNNEMVSDFIEDIDIPEDEPEPEPEPEEQPEITPPPDASLDSLEIITDTSKVTNFVVNPPVLPPPPIKDKKKKKKKVIVYDVPQKQATYPGGIEELYKFLGNNIKYPMIAREAGVEGKVLVQFVIWKDGSVSETKVIRGIGGGCDEEALRVVDMMINWIPAEQAGEKVASRFVLPIRFELD